MCHAGHVRRVTVLLNVRGPNGCHRRFKGNLVGTRDANPSFLCRFAGRMAAGRYSVGGLAMGLADGF